MSEDVNRSETNLLVFISSRMNSEMEPARKIAVEAVKRVEFVQVELEQPYPCLGTIYSLCSVYYPNIR